MKYAIATLAFLACVQLVSAQRVMRPVAELINYADPGWKLVRQWIDSATNPVEVLPADTNQTKSVLYQTQVTTRSPMGAIVFQTGGLLVDGGWIRIIGGGGERMKRSLPSWNRGKTGTKEGEIPLMYLIADDAVGGFFALNGGKLGMDTNLVYYLSPDGLQWEPLELTYTDFLDFCFRGDLKKFYGSLRWSTWQKDLASLSPDKVFNFIPYLWSKEGKDIEKNTKKIVPVEEQYQFNLSARTQLKLDQ